MDLCLSSRVPPSGRREQAEEGRGAGLRLVLLTYGCHWNPFPVLPGHLQPNIRFVALVNQWVFVLVYGVLACASGLWYPG